MNIQTEISQLIKSVLFHHKTNIHIAIYRNKKSFNFQKTYDNLVIRVL